MNSDCFSLIKQEDSINNDMFDAYLYNPDLSVSAMIEKYDVLEIKSKEKKSLCCAVCGGRAFGYNFDQITCESCKAFFRRNAFKNMTEIQCRFGGNCSITVANRRHCAHCRIKKCFAVGMKKEWIRTEEEKHMKRNQLEKNKRIKRSLQMTIRRHPGQFDFISILSSRDKTHLNNVNHCYEQYTGEPSIFKYSAPNEVLFLRLHDFYNRKKPIIINFISYFKHLPEFQQLDVDDQVLLIKENIRILLPINYALLKTPVHSQFRYTNVQTIGCINNINLHPMYQSLSNTFGQFVVFDPLIIKLFIIVLFFTTNSQSMNIDIIDYKQSDYIKRIQSTYLELLWLYMNEKCGEIQAINLLTTIVTKFLHLQTMIDDIDSIIRLNNDIQYLDPLMKTILQLT